MPPPVRRKTIVLVLALGAALALAGVAFAGNGGFAPVPPESPNANRIHQSYLWISAFALAIVVVVEGPQIHGATRLELIWTAIPVLILVAIAGFIFYKLPGIQDVPAATAEGGPLEIRVNAHQFYWQFNYPNGAISIDEMHAPVERTVRVVIDSADVAHSWWIPALGGKFDAIPGRTNETWFKAERLGTFRGQCGEFCGVLHAQMEAHADIESSSAYKAWVSTTARRELGRSQWEGVCAKCHGLTGHGGYGPAIYNSSILIQPQTLRRLLEEGQNTSGGVAVYMPPVGRGWTDEQFRALEGYMRRNIYKPGGASGG